MPNRKAMVEMKTTIPKIFAIIGVCLVMVMAGSIVPVFIILKFLGWINWSWWWVLSPIWIPLAVDIVIVIPCTIIAGIIDVVMGFFIRRRARRKVKVKLDEFAEILAGFTEDMSKQSQYRSFINIQQFLLPGVNKSDHIHVISHFLKASGLDRIEFETPNTQHVHYHTALSE